MNFKDWLLQSRTNRWNALIPKCAINVKIGETHTTYIHPTKGRRVVNNKRLGL